MCTCSTFFAEFISWNCRIYFAKQNKILANFLTFISWKGIEIFFKNFVNETKFWFAKTTVEAQNENGKYDEIEMNKGV